MTLSRSPLIAVLALPVLLLAGCTTPVAPEAPEAREAPGFDALVAAFPSDDELPDGFVAGDRCPGGEFCSADADADHASVSGDGVAEPTDEWMSDSFWLSVTVYDDADAAETALDNAIEEAETHSGDYAFEMEETENGFIPGEEGHGSFDDYAVGDWSGIERVTTLSYSGSWTDAASDDRQQAAVTLTNGATVLNCRSQYRADAGENLARDACRTTIDEFLERLAEQDPSAAPVVMTPRRAAEALPQLEDFPSGSEVSVRCPGDDPCDDEDQTQDASISVNVALPEGVESEGDDDWGRFRVAGGEWTEDLWLRVWIHPNAASATDQVDENIADYRELTGTLDTAPVETESGYTYGIRGTGEVIDIGGEGWTGALKVYDAQFVHLDGRITERVYDISASAASGSAFVGVDSTLTVQGRTMEDAIEFVTGQLDAYFARLAAVGTAD